MDRRIVGEEGKSKRKSKGIGNGKSKGGRGKEKELGMRRRKDLLHCLTRSFLLLYASVNSFKKSLSFLRLLMSFSFQTSSVPMPSLWNISSLRSKFWMPGLLPKRFGLGVEVRALGFGGGGRFGSRLILHLEGSGCAIVVFGGGRGRCGGGFEQEEEGEGEGVGG
jgi:hypothetical protein